MAAFSRDVITSPPDPTSCQLGLFADDDKQYRRALIGAWDAPIRVIASRHAPRRSDTDDLRQAGRVAVYWSALRYKASVGVPFSHYAKRAIKNRITREAARLVGRRRSEVPLDEVPGDQPAVMPVPDPRLELVREWTRNLPHPHAAVYRLLYVEGLSQRSAAVELGVSQPRVSQMHKSLLDFGRAELVG